MGSKRKIAPALIRYMASSNPDKRVFVDLFGGGGAMSFAALESGFFDSVHYNEINTAVVNLLRKIQTDGVTEEFYQWISRERFFELIGGSDWLAGLAQTCWSFGNNQRSYLYGREIEADKKRLHDEIVIGTPLNEIHDKRLAILAQMNDGVMLENLTRLQHFPDLAALATLAKLRITNLDYRAVPIPDGAIVYCDIPYQSTEEYKHGNFDHVEFYEWCRQSPHKIYVSSYETPLHLAYELNHRSTLSAINRVKKVVERLYSNQPEAVAADLFGF